MTLKQLQALVKKGESETLEFKTTTSNIDAAMSTVCAFLNNDRDGVVLIGVKDSGVITGLDLTDKVLQNLAAEIRKIEPVAKINVQYISLKNDKKVIAISVSPDSRAPYMYDGRLYVRIQSTTSRMTREQYEYLYHKNNPQRWESFTNNSCTINDLDKTRIKDVIRLGVVHERIPAADLKLSVPDILRKFNLIVDDKLTNAAVVLFCKKEERQFMQSNLQVARFEGIDKTIFYDQKYFVGNAFDLCDKAMDFLHFHLPVGAHIEPGKIARVETPAIPYNVLREAIINALVHRDYSFAGGSMTIARYDDRVVITNFGSLPKGVSINKLGKEHLSVRRNPLIAEVFFRCGSIEKWGRGTNIMIENCKNAGNPLPIFEEIGNGFSVTLPLRESTKTHRPVIKEQEEQLPRLTDRQNNILDILKSGPLHRDQITKQVKGKSSDRTIQRELTHLKDMGLIKIVGTTKDALWVLAS